MSPEGTSTAAAAAPAPAAGAAAAAATAAPAAPKGTVDAIQEARQNLAERGTILPEGQPPEGETDEQRTTREAAEAAAETPEQQAAREAAEAAETPEQQAAREAAAGEHPFRVTLTSGEGEEAKELAFDAPNEEVFQELSKRLAPEEDHDELLVTYPGLAERGEQDIQVELPDGEALERHRRMVNDAQVGRQVKTERRAIDRQREQIESFDDAIEQDPVGVLLERTKPEIRAEVVWHALLTPGVLEELQARLAKEQVESLDGLMQDPQLLRALRAEASDARNTMRERVRTTTAAKREASAAARRVSDQVEAALPSHLEGDDRDRVYSGALGFLRENLGSLPAAAIKPALVAAFLTDYLQAQGIALQPVGPGNGKLPVAPKAPQVAAKTGAQFTQAAAARRSASAAAPAGAGALPSKARPALPESTAERIALMRKQGIARTLGL
jgi:hypothetical protein